jgi:archaellum component FlaC
MELTNKPVSTLLSIIEIQQNRIQELEAQIKHLETMLEMTSQTLSGVMNQNEDFKD